MGHQAGSCRCGPEIKFPDRDRPATHVTDNRPGRASNGLVPGRRPDPCPPLADTHAFTIQLDPHKPTRSNKRNLLCSHCKRRGHDRDTCLKLTGPPSWYIQKYGSCSSHGVSPTTAMYSSAALRPKILIVAPSVHAHAVTEPCPSLLTLLRILPLLAKNKFNFF